MLYARLVVLLLMALLWGCSSDSESPVRGNVHEIYRGHLWEDGRCSEQSFEYCCLERGLTTCTTYDHVFVAAVRRYGDRVGVLIVSNGDHLILAESADRGGTWTTQDLEDTDFIRGGQVYIGSTDLVMTATDTWIYIPRLEVGALGQQYARGYLYRAVPTGSGYSALATDDLNLPGAPPIEVRDGRAFFLVTDSDPRGGPQNLWADEVDPANRSTDRAALVVCPMPGCRTINAFRFLGSDDGELYSGLTGSVAPSPECLIAFNRSTQALSAICVPYSEWPGTGGDAVVLPYAGHEASVLKAFDRNGHVWAATIVDAGGGVGRPSDPVDLGPGKVFTNGTFSGWPRFRGMAIVQPLPGDGTTPSNLTTRIVRVPQMGAAQDVVLPVTPCEDDAKCGYRELTKGELIGQMTWTLSLGDDDYLVFYKSDAAAGIGATQQVVSVALEHATYKDIPGDTLPIDGAVGYVNGVQMVGIAAMCARKVSCTPGQPDALLRCMNYWTTRPTVDAAKHYAAMQSFLASPPGCSGFGSCNGLQPNCGQTGGACDPGGGGNGSGACVYPAAPTDCNTCTGDGKAITCSGSTVTSVLDCAAVGQTCTCNGSSCACVAPPCTATAPSCVGAVYTTCAETHDCAVTQQNCTLEPGGLGYFPGCAPAATGDCSPTTAYGEIWCDGKYFMVCVSGQPQSYNCVANGFTRCGYPDQYSGVPQCVL